MSSPSTQTSAESSSVVSKTTVLAGRVEAADLLRNRHGDAVPVEAEPAVAAAGAERRRRDRPPIPSRRSPRAPACGVVVVGLRRPARSAGCRRRARESPSRRSACRCSATGPATSATPSAVARSIEASGAPGRRDPAAPGVWEKRRRRRGGGAPPPRGDRFRARMSAHLHDVVGEGRRDLLEPVRRAGRDDHDVALLELPRLAALRSRCPGPRPARSSSGRRPCRPVTNVAVPSST